ncbi:MAG: hypothetical protein JXR76_05095 [Deltaproteobacteria bacterium]|nr:hypothetical protein [Deltaproteobacteria bacterium]
MQNIELFGFVILFLGIILGRILSEKAMGVLGADQKVRLMDAFSGVRKYSLLPLLAVLVAYVGLVQAGVLTGSLPHAVFLIVLLVYLVASQIFVYRRLTRIGLPMACIRRFHMSQAVVIIVFLVWSGITLHGTLFQ